MQRRSHHIEWLSSVAFAVSASLAHAQEQNAAAAVPNADPLSLEEITVSARRRDETLHDTPIAITAISTNQLESKGSTNLSELQGAAPNLLITSQNSGAATANLSIRGLTFADVEKSFDPTVAVVVDGVFLGTSTGQMFDFFDVSKIEILRGPQGTLFGRNTIGGVINITRTRPTGEWGGKFDISYGRFDTRAVRAVFNAPLKADVLAAKAFYFDNRSDGFYTNGATGDRVGSSATKNYGAALQLTPAGTDIDALLTLEKQEQQFEPINSDIARTGEVFCFFEPANQCDRNTTTDLYTVFGERTNATYSSPAATLQVSFPMASAQVTSVTGYRDSDEDHTQDFDASTADLYVAHRLQTYHQFSQELRAGGKMTESLDYVAGAYYFDSGYTLTQFTRVFGADLPSPQIAHGKAKSTAAFADFIWQFATQYRLNFGGRYTEDKKDFDNSFGVPLGAASKSFSKFTPKVSVDFRPNDNYMFYASYSEGYRSGGFSNRAQTAISTVTPFGPETVDSSEIGAKMEFADRRIALNVAIFHSKYDSLQQNTTIPGGPTGNETIVTNVGSATIKGLEADIIGRVSQSLTLTGSIGLQDSGFSGFLTQAPVNGVLRTFDYSANNMIYSPDFMGSFGAEYVRPVSFGEFRTSLTYRHIGSYDQQISDGSTSAPPATGVIVVPGNDPRVVAEAQDLLDASISTIFDAGHGKTRVTLFGRNLADDRGPNAAFTVAGLWSFASAREPRTYGVQVGYEF
jgi:iron complex outermembrane receptor protein